MIQPEQPTAEDLAWDLQESLDYFNKFGGSRTQGVALRRALAAEAEREEYLTLLHAECDRTAALEERLRRIAYHSSEYGSSFNDDKLALKEIHAIASGEE